MGNSAIVLGCGLVGATMARELARSSNIAVTVADVSDERLRRVASDRIKTARADLSDRAALQKLIAPFDIVLGALPSRFGLATLESVVRAGKNYCDISFMPEDPLRLDGLAKEKGVTAIVDCGVSPGLSNLMVGFAAAQLGALHSYQGDQREIRRGAEEIAGGRALPPCQVDQKEIRRGTESAGGRALPPCQGGTEGGRVERAEIYVGGLPKIRRWPYDYKAPFAPSDVIEEYTRPARMIENGREVVKPALSEPELIHLSHAGTLEAFNTDGLRTLLRTIKADNMKEKTMRFPGHAELMRVLRETGFFSQEPISVPRVEDRARRTEASGLEVVHIRPLDVTSKLLFPKWSFDEGEEEFTVLRVFVEGTCGSPLPLGEGSGVRASVPRAEASGHSSLPLGEGLGVKATADANEPHYPTRKQFTFDLYDEYDKVRGESSMARTTAFPNVIAALAVAEGRIREKGVFAPEVLGQQPGVFEHFLAELQRRGVRVSWKS